jgi:hypothetical protein
MLDRQESTLRPQNTTKPVDAPTVSDIDGYQIEYDLDALDEFLDQVFHSLPTDAVELVWSVKGRPGYPADWARFEKTLRRSKLPRALYYGTSSVYDTGELRNRRESFAGLHVIVLDDIGTKVATPPPALAGPSYVLESSPGNYQWGYVLDEPVTDLRAASALVSLIYESGVTDAGGATALKLVRLPGGVNGKVGTKQLFNVRLTEATWRHWSPQELLDAVEAGVRWEDVLADARAAQRRPTARSVTPWMPVEAQAPNGDGLVDPVLEWLYAEGWVLQESNEWITIKCPWRAQHTNGDPSAGYSPLGRGGEFASQRGFKCFHEHCQHHRTPDFLWEVAGQGGPEVPVAEPVTLLARQWAFDPVDEVCYQIIDSPSHEAITLNALRTTHPGKVKVYSADGKAKYVHQVDVWKNQPNKVLVYGTINDPSTEAPVVDYAGRLRCNTFSRPAWDGEAFADDIEMFEGFIEYLIPEPDERKFFLDWLAAKFQNMAFRGPGIVMVAEGAGTGRGTLAKLLTALFGPRNVAAVPWRELVGHSDFNEWQSFPLAITHETLDTEGAGVNQYRAYEHLKTIIETQPTISRVNIKRVTARHMPVFTSHILYTNHERGLIIPQDDRRLYVLRNPSTPASPAYFTKLYKWLEEPWQDSVATFLRERPVDPQALLAPPPMTAGKARMVDTSRTPLDAVMHALVARWEGRFIVTSLISKALDPYRRALRLDVDVGGNKRIAHAVERVSVSTKYRVSMTRGGAYQRVRLLRARLDSTTDVYTRTTGMISAEALREEVGLNSIDKIRDIVAAVIENV